MDEALEGGVGCAWQGESAEIDAAKEAELDCEQLMDVLGVGESFFEVDRGGVFAQGPEIAVDVGNIAQAGAAKVAEG